MLHLSDSRTDKSLQTPTTPEMEMSRIFHCNPVVAGPAQNDSKLTTLCQKYENKLCRRKNARITETEATELISEPKTMNEESIYEESIDVITKEHTDFFYLNCLPSICTTTILEFLCCNS